MNNPGTIPHRRGRRPKDEAKKVRLIREYYRKYTAKECAEILGIPVNTVRYLLKKHGIRITDGKTESKAETPPPGRRLSMSIARWRQRLEDAIRKDYPTSPTADIAEKAEASYYTVARNAKRMGTRKSKTFMRRRWASGGSHTPDNGRRMEMEQYLKQHFHDTRNEDLAGKFGVDVKTIRRHARRLGLQKSREFMYDSRKKGRSGKKVYADEFLAWRIQCIAEVYPSGNEQQLQALQEKVGLSLGYIKKIANENGIRRDKEAYYSKELIAAVREYFPTHTDKECAEHFGVKKAFIQYMARKFGMYKTASHLQGIYDENISRCHKSAGRQDRRDDDATG